MLCACTAVRPIFHYADHQTNTSYSLLLTELNCVNAVNFACMKATVCLVKHVYAYSVVFFFFAFSVRHRYFVQEIKKAPSAREA